jgi:hypothetical protein
MKIVHLFLLFTFYFSLHSCYTPRYVYSPTAHNVPVLVKKGDSKLAVNYSANLGGNSENVNAVTAGTSDGYDLQAAYAFTRHWAIQVNYYHRKEIN